MRTETAFTLIELLIVISIIGLLSVVLIPNVLRAREKAEGVAVKAYIRHCITAIESSRTLNSLRIPTNISSCQDPIPSDQIIVERPPYIDSDVVHIKSDGDTYDIRVISKSRHTFEYDGFTIREY